MVLSSKQVSSDTTLDWAAQNLLLHDGLVTVLGLPKQQQSSSRSGNDQQNSQKEQQQAEAATMNVIRCPRCDSANTKFCYYNNYNRSQPRHFCKTCRRHWTKGGTLRNVPVGGGRKKNTNNNKKRLVDKTQNTGSSPAKSTTTASARGGDTNNNSTGDSLVTSHSGTNLGPNSIKPILQVHEQPNYYFVNKKHVSVGSSYNNSSSKSGGGLAVDATTTSRSDPQMPSFPLLTAHMHSVSSNNENFDDSPLPSLHHESDPANLIEFAEDQFNTAHYSLSSSAATPLLMPPSSVHLNNHNFLDPGFWKWDDLATSSVSSDLKYFPYLDDPR